MMERTLGFDKMVYGDVCQRSNNAAFLNDEDIEDFEEEILAALEEE